MHDPRINPLKENELIAVTNGNGLIRASWRTMMNGKQVLRESPDTLPGLSYMYSGIKMLREARERYLRDFGYQQDLDAYTGDLPRDFKEMDKRPAQVQHAMFVDIETNLARMVLNLRNNLDQHETYVADPAIATYIEHARMALQSFSEIKVVGLRQQIYDAVHEGKHDMSEKDIRGLKTTQAIYANYAGFCFGDYSGYKEQERQGKKGLREEHQYILDEIEKHEKMQPFIASGDLRPYTTPSMA